MTDWLTNGGFGFAGAVLGYLIPAFVSRKKDAGELASDLLAQAIERIDRLEKDAAACHSANLALTLRCERNEFVSDLVIVELHAHAPGSPVLAQARALLSRAFPMRGEARVDGFDPQH
jgi:hypothetical protein